jgi:hypothetical protein
MNEYGLVPGDAAVRQAALDLASVVPGAVVSQSGATVTFPLVLPGQVQSASDVVASISRKHTVHVKQMDLRFPLARVTFEPWTTPASRTLDSAFGGLTGSVWLAFATVAAIGLVGGLRGSGSPPPPPTKPPRRGGGSGGSSPRQGGRRSREYGGEDYEIRVSLRPRQGSGQRRYTLAELQALPTLSTGQADDLKVDTGTERVWLARVGVVDGMPYDNMVSVQRNEGGRWVLTPFG